MGYLAMTVPSLKVNINVDFVIEQLNDNLFLCSSIPDRTVLIEKKLDQYTYVIVFNDSEFEFTYQTRYVQFTNRPSFTVLEKIEHDLKNCFLHYVDESYSRKWFDVEAKNISAIFEMSKEGDLFSFHVGMTYITDGCVAVPSNSFIYDPAMDMLYVRSDVKPEKFKDLFEATSYSKAFFQFYLSVDDKSLVILDKYSRYSKNMIVTYFEHSLYVSLASREHINAVGSPEYIRNTLNAFIVRHIALHPTDELIHYVGDFGFDMATLSIEDLQTFKMATC
jgi:hypothetical protein